MSADLHTKTHDRGTQNVDGAQELNKSPMMTHLLGALQEGTDIGDYGRLVLVMVARHFLPEDEIVGLLSGQPDHDETKAKALFLQVSRRDYNPPKREKILQWQAQQDFPICPDSDDPQACNVYRELDLPDEVFQQINQFWEERAASDTNS